MAAPTKRCACYFFQFTQRFNSLSFLTNVPNRCYTTSLALRHRTPSFVSTIEREQASSTIYDDGDQIHGSFKRASDSRPRPAGLTFNQSKIKDATDICESSVGVMPTRLGADDKNFRRTVNILKHRVSRHRERITSLEGPALIQRAVAAGLNIKTVYFTAAGSSLRILLGEVHLRELTKMGTEFYEIGRKELLSMCGTNVVTDTTVVGICEIPEPNGCESSTRSDEQRLPITVIADNVRDPGNMSMLLSSSLAAACQNLLLTKGCVDVWDPKVMRTAEGAQFNVSMQTELTWTDIERVLPTDSFILLADNCSLITSSDSERECKISSRDYCSVDYTRHGSIVLVVGGETEGLSIDAYNLCQRRGGTAINIPMLTGMDSLNASVAGGVIIFEIARQMRKKVLPQKSS